MILSVKFTDLTISRHDLEQPASVKKLILLE